MAKRSRPPFDPFCDVETRLDRAKRALRMIESRLEAGSDLPEMKLRVPRLDLALAVELDRGAAFLVLMDPLDDLNTTQREVLILRFRGLTYMQSARRLGISKSNVKYHLNEIVRKLAAENRHHLSILGYFVAGTHHRTRDRDEASHVPVSDPEPRRERAKAALRSMHARLEGAAQLREAGVAVRRLDRVLAVELDRGTAFLVLMESVDDLSRIQRQILALRFRGLLYKQIPELLQTSMPNVEYHFKAIATKLAAKNRLRLEALGFFLAGWDDGRGW